MPILTEQMPRQNKYIRAEQLMSENLICLNMVSKMEDIKSALSSSHHGFPVTNSKGRVVGLIPKNFLIILIENKVFYSEKNENMCLFDSPKPIVRRKT